MFEVIKFLKSPKVNPYLGLFLKKSDKVLLTFISWKNKATERATDQHFMSKKPNLPQNFEQVKN